jgi:hypothetical protein
VINSTRNLSKTEHRSTRWQTHRLALNLGAVFFLGIAAAAPAGASSHMDAPLITLDPAANTTDVYAFLSQNAFGQKFLSTALAVFPFEQPGIGPNAFRFDDRVAYDIHVSLDNDNIGKGKVDLTYRFRFKTVFPNDKTILTYLGPVEPAGPGVFPANQNLRQTYTVTLIDHRIKGVTSPFINKPTLLGTGMVPPNNQGRVTRFYNLNNDGDQPAKPGVANPDDLDPYTKNTIFELQRGHRVFAGQREDGFYADVQSIFDLDFSFGRDRNTPTKPFDSQSGFNVHTIVLNIPISQLEGVKIAGVYATTSRTLASLLDDDSDGDEKLFKQVGRQGNPLFNEILVAHVDKDRYSESKPTDDAKNFSKYANNPEVALALGTKPITFPDMPEVSVIPRIFIPDLIKVDLTTPPARLAGSPDFNRLGAFGGDVLKSTVQDPLKNGGFIPGGWPNGRRFGDDVVNIALIALGVPATPLLPSPVSRNDNTYNRVFPYAATPHNGRNINPSTPNQF